MRSLILSLVLANAALLSAPDVASAQSPTTYPWCSRSSDRSSNITCYFTSKEQCQRTTSGIGAYCFPSPSRASGNVVPPRRTRRRRRFRAAVSRSATSVDWAGPGSRDLP